MHDRSKHAESPGARTHVTERIVITPQRRDTDRPPPLVIRFHPHGTPTPTPAPSGQGVPPPPGAERG